MRIPRPAISHAISFRQLLRGHFYESKMPNARKLPRTFCSLERLEDRVVFSGMPGTPLPFGDLVLPSVSALVQDQGQYASAELIAEGEGDSSAAVPAPFWRKTSAAPTYAPDWYANSGAVTREVFYDSALTAAQNGDSLKRVISSLTAGAHVRIHGGTYIIDSYFTIQAAGTAERPVTIEGAPGENVIITRSDATQNVVNIDQTQYLTLQNLTIRGGSTGLKLASVNQFMLHNVEVHSTANNAVAANSRNTSYLYFIDNHIHDTGGHGEGFYLGAHDGSYVTHHTYVIGNYIHDLNAPSVDQGDGIEIKDGSYAVTVKYNFIKNTNYPGIIAYRTGRGAVDRNVIEENVVVSSNDVGIQVTAEAIVRNNLVVGSRSAFLSKPFYTNPRYLTVANNTFVSGGQAVKTYNWDNATIQFANNAIYSSTGQYISTGTGNAIVSSNGLISNLATTFVNLKVDGTALDATPILGSTLIGNADLAYLPPLDLRGNTRITAADAGAVDYRADAVAVNTPPTVTVSAPLDGFSGVRGQARTFRLSATDSPEDMASGFSYLIDWGDGKSETILKGAFADVVHAYETAGTFNVRVTAADQKNATSPTAVRGVSIVAVETQGNQLTVGGTAASDTLQLNELSIGQFGILLNNVLVATSVPGTDGRIALFGNSGSDTLFGMNQFNTWELNGIRSGTLNKIFVFDGVENLAGGTTDDNFRLGNGATGFASIVGGTGIDTIDYSASTNAITASLQMRSIDGVSAFSSVENLIGSSSINDTLVGADFGNVWTLSGANSGKVQSFAFSNFENLKGGASVDKFLLSTIAGAVSGTLDGGAGVDTLAAANVANVWDLNGENSGQLNTNRFQAMEDLTGGTAADDFRFNNLAKGFGTVSGGSGVDRFDFSLSTNPITISFQSRKVNGVNYFSGIDSLIGSSSNGDKMTGADYGTTWTINGPNKGIFGEVEFAKFENLAGGSSIDNFQFTAQDASLSGSVDGGGGIDTLTGSNFSNVWYLNGANAGQLNSSVFRNLENLNGGTAVDEFRFNSAALGFGTVSGGSGADTLDYSSTTNTVSVNLQSKISTGVAQFLAFETFVGGASANDALSGTDLATTWKFLSRNAGVVGSQNFSSFENITGGAGDDIVQWSPGSSVDGQVDGGSGMNAVDYSYWTSTGVNVSLIAGTATAVGSIRNIQVVVGSAQDDILTGDAGSNVLIGGQGNDLLSGGDGRDLLFGGSGADVLRGGGQDDLLFGGRIAGYNEAAKNLSLKSINAILSKWTSGASYVDRIASLKGTEITSSSFIDDAAAADQLFGDEASDWFITPMGDVAVDAFQEIITVL